MTDLNSTAVPPGCVVHALRRSYHHATALRSAAAAASSNFRWLHLQHFRQIPLLDYDIVVGAYPLLALHKRIVRQRPDVEYAFLSDYSGPATVRYFLKNLTDYVVPPGAAAELLNGLDELTHRLSARARRFVNRLQGAHAMDDPSSILVDPKYQRTRDLFIHDLTTFSEDFENLHLVKTLLDHATPTEELLGQEPPDPTDADAFRNSYAFLQGTRPGYSQNNLHDALNAALVVRLFNLSRARRSELAPVLISHTRVVQQLNELSLANLGLETSTEMPFLFSNALFLVLSEAFAARTDGRYSVAAAQAAMLTEDAEGLADSCIDLLNPVQTFLDRGAPEKEIQIADLPADDWGLLLYRRKLFSRRWGAIFGAPLMASESDRVEYLRLLLSPGLRDSISPDNPTQYDALMRRVEQQLRLARPADQALWGAVMSASRPAAGGSKRSPAEAAFSMFVSSYSGGLLRDITPSLPIQNFEPPNFDDDHNLRISVLPAYVSCGAIVTAGSLRDSRRSPRRYLSITWLHSQDGRTLGSLCHATLAKLIPAGSLVRCQLFTSGSEIQFDADISASAEELCRKLSEAADVECFHLKGPGARFYADLVALEGIERQAGFVFDSALWTGSVARSFEQLIDRTLEIPIKVEYVHDVFGSIVEKLCLRKLPDRGAGGTYG
jgi:hypothetical protein